MSAVGALTGDRILSAAGHRAPHIPVQPFRALPDSLILPGNALAQAVRDGYQPEEILEPEEIEEIRRLIDS